MPSVASQITQSMHANVCAQGTKSVSRQVNRSRGVRRCPFDNFDKGFSYIDTVGLLPGEIDSTCAHTHLLIDTQLGGTKLPFII